MNKRQNKRGLWITSLLSTTTKIATSGSPKCLGQTLSSTGVTLTVSRLWCLRLGLFCQSILTQSGKQQLMSMLGSSGKLSFMIWEVRISRRTFHTCWRITVTDRQEWALSGSKTENSFSRKRCGGTIQSQVCIPHTWSRLTIRGSPTKKAKWEQHATLWPWFVNP